MYQKANIMKRKKNCGSLLIVFVFIVAFSEAFASGGNTNCQLEYLNHKLSVDAEEVPLSFLLSKIQEKTGIKIQLPKEEPDRMISVRFQSLSIDRALGNILSELNHAVISGPEGKIQEVIIVGKSNIPLKSQNRQTSKIPPSSNALNMDLPSKGGMKYHQSPKKMMTGGMGNHRSPGKTKIRPDGMITTNSSDKTNTTPDGMIIINSEI